MSTPELAPKASARRRTAPAFPSAATSASAASTVPPAPESASAPESPAAAAPKRTRAEINRANAQRSTGPRTSEGKANSSRNSFKHGLYASALCLPNEDSAQLNELRASLRAEHQPANTTEDILVNELAENFWRIRRMRDREAFAMQPGNIGSWVQNGLLALVQRSMASAERAFHRALNALRQLQKARGFVPQICADAADAADATAERTPAPASITDPVTPPEPAAPPDPAAAAAPDPGFVPEYPIEVISFPADDSGRAAFRAFRASVLAALPNIKLPLDIPGVE